MWNSQSEFGTVGSLKSSLTALKEGRVSACGTFARMSATGQPWAASPGWALTLLERRKCSELTIPYPQVPEALHVIYTLPVAGAVIVMNVVRNLEKAAGRPSSYARSQPAGDTLLARAPKSGPP